MLKQSGSGRQRSKEGLKFHLVIKTGIALAVTVWLLYQLKHLLSHHKQGTSQAAISSIDEATSLGLEQSRMAVVGGGALKFGRKGLILADGEITRGKIENTNGMEIKEERGDDENNGERLKEEEDDDAEVERIEDLVDGDDKADAEEEDDGNEEERAIEQLDFQAEEVDSDFLDRGSE